MILVIEIQSANSPNSKWIPSPYVKNMNPDYEKKIELVKSIIEKMDLNYEVKSGNNLNVLTDKPTMEIDIFISTYANQNFKSAL